MADAKAGHAQHEEARESEKNVSKAPERNLIKNLPLTLLLKQTQSSSPKHHSKEIQHIKPNAPIHLPRLPRQRQEKKHQICNDGPRLRPPVLLPTSERTHGHRYCHERERDTDLPRAPLKCTGKESAGKWRRGGWVCHQFEVENMKGEWCTESGKKLTRIVWETLWNPYREKFTI